MLAGFVESFLGAVMGRETGGNVIPVGEAGCLFLDIHNIKLYEKFDKGRRKTINR